MNFRILFIASVALFAGLGCNPTGTCVSEKEVADSLGAECVINMTKTFCDAQDSTQFFAEAGSAGMFRCKSLGYEEGPGATRATDSKALHSYYKKSASGGPKK